MYRFQYREITITPSPFVVLNSIRCKRVFIFPLADIFVLYVCVCVRQDLLQRSW